MKIINKEEEQLNLVILNKMIQLIKIMNNKKFIQKKFKN